VHEWLDLAIEAAKEAGKAILGVYKHEHIVTTKDDGSPLTVADRQGHRIILKKLAVTGIPVVSEEGDDLHLGCSRYWLVDSLDGTKDFLAGNDEFTVNIALVIDASPVLGVVYAPALDELYTGALGLGAWKDQHGKRVNCAVAEKSSSCRMAISRFHDHPDVKLFATANGIVERVAVGSALKYGQLACATVDVFPRLVGTSEWDTAAGQAVLEAAGGQVLDWHTGAPLRYGKPKRRNPRLLSLRAPYTFTDFELKTYEPELL
jgi:3'(2'), 5'-bisphosphate nucleotidase